MQNVFRDLVLQGGEGRSRSDTTELVGMRPIASPLGYYRGTVHGLVDLADLHPHAHASVPGIAGFAAHSCDNDFMFPSGISQILPQSGGMRHTCFGGHPSHLTGSDLRSPPGNSSRTQTKTSAHHNADYHMRDMRSAKPNHNAYYSAAGPHATGGSQPQVSRTRATRLEQHDLLPQVAKRKFPSCAAAATEEEDALTELVKENQLLKQQLALASHQVHRLKQVLEAYDITHQDTATGAGAKSQSRYWTEEEHQRFLHAIQNYGHKDVKAIASLVGTRSATQVRTHAQKYLIKLARSRKQGHSSGAMIKLDELHSLDSHSPRLDSLHRHKMQATEDASEDGGEELDEEEQVAGTDTSLEAAAALAAAKGGSSAAAATAFQQVAATQSKQQAQERQSKAICHTLHSHSRKHTPAKPHHEKGHGAGGLLVGSSAKSIASSSIQRKNSMRHRASKTREALVPMQDKTPGSPGSMASTASDATSNGKESNGSNGPSMRSSDTTNGNGSSNCSYSNGHGNNGSSGSGCEGGSGGGHSNKGSNSNEGSDHGFFDTAGEDGGNFSDELDGTGAGSDMFSSCSFTGV